MNEKDICALLILSKILCFLAFALFRKNSEICAAR